jgi:hypothetical protein
VASPTISESIIISIPEIVLLVIRPTMAGKLVVLVSSLLSPSAIVGVCERFSVGITNNF